MEPKVIAFYLPQFHETPENNKWWGQGFTEWTNTKKSRPLFQGHNQPREPLNDNYYCLLNPETQEWQAELAKKYNIYGFCYYHYWFDGKMLIEKPMENMLKNHNVDLPFCISWANEPWTKTWTGREKEVLMPQKYGGESDWEKHLKYLIPFFNDKRYIKKDNKPVMLLYRTVSITRCSEMIDYWNKRLIEEGFNGIYIIETLTGHQKQSCLENSDAQAEMEPMLTIRHHLPLWKQGCRYITKILNKKGVNIFDKMSYDLIWSHIINKKRAGNKKTYLGAFADWDNSARWGRKAMVITGATPDKFKPYFEKQYNKAKEMDSEFIFFNAWNEWGEGTYLEPDKKFKYGYLEKIKEVTTKQEK